MVGESLGDPAGEGAASRHAPAKRRQTGATGERATSETIVEDFLQTDRVGIEIGARLIPLARSEHGNVLVDRVMSLRRDLAKKNGVWVPSIRIRDNIQLEPNAYRFFINGREIARGTIRVGSLPGPGLGESRSSPWKGRRRRNPPSACPRSGSPRTTRPAPSWPATPSSTPSAC